jgi:hypothetical protein
MHLDFQQPLAFGWNGYRAAQRIIILLKGCTIDRNGAIRQSDIGQTKSKFPVDRFVFQVEDVQDGFTALRQCVGVDRFIQTIKKALCVKRFL